jgi:hypothetical protein
MKLSIASSPMQTHNGSRIDSQKHFCNDIAGSPCVKKSKGKRFNLKGFMSVPDDDSN